MKAADDAFQRELVRAYGENNAGDARYKTQHDDEAVQKAGDAFVAASNAWREAVRDARQTVASQEATMQVPQQTDQAEAWMLKHVELGTVGRALEGATLEQKIGR